MRKLKAAAAFLSALTVTSAASVPAAAVQLGGIANPATGRQIPVVPIIIAGGALVVAGVGAAVFFIVKKKNKGELPDDLPINDDSDDSGAPSPYDDDAEPSEQDTPDDAGDAQESPAEDDADDSGDEDNSGGSDDGYDNELPLDGE